jgi:pimeloyl-ACP methyl ester carboxylesterase
MLDLICMPLIGGVRQKIHVLSSDAKLPVLLFLHGGPGIPNRGLALSKNADLLNSFTLCAWDQRGTGGSWRGVKTASLNTTQLTKDAAEVAAWLCKKFRKNKIFVLGGSWGSELGTMLADRFPEHIAAFVGFGQVVDGAKNEELSYKFALEAALEAGDKKNVNALIKLGPPKNGQYKHGFAGLLIQRQVMTQYGGYSQNESKRSLQSALIIPILKNKEYTPYDLFGIVWGGAKIIHSDLMLTLGSPNMAVTCPKFKMPYFIFDGKHDQNTPASLVEDYFAAIEAPRKELIWFEESAHNPMADESEKFKNLLREKLGEVAAAEKAKGVFI